MASLAGFRVERLVGQDRSLFCCGNSDLDHYLQKQAKQEERRNISTPFVSIEKNSQQIAGYYTLSAASLITKSLPVEVSKKLPHYPDQPAILLGRLAIDQKFRGQGLGSALLLESLERCCISSSGVAAFAVIVQAIDDLAVRFYEKHGFQKFLDQNRKLFLPIKTIQKLFEND